MQHTAKVTSAVAKGIRGGILKANDGKINSTCNCKIEENDNQPVAKAVLMTKSTNNTAAQQQNR